MDSVVESGWPGYVCYECGDSTTAAHLKDQAHSTDNEVMTNARKLSP